MYKGRMFVREVIYACGDYMDASIYPVYQPAGKRRAKCKPSSEVQQKINRRRSELELLRAIHANFCEDDIFLTVTYRETPASVEDAERALRNFFRRVKRRRQKLGLPPLKYVYCTEKGKKSGRIHHHVIMSGGLGRDELEKIWGAGYANSRRLQLENGAAGLASYMAKGAADERPTWRRWSGSRNLVRPEPDIRDGVISARTVREMGDALEESSGCDYFEALFDGYRLTAAEYVKNPANAGDYIFVQMYRKPPARRKE